MTPERLAYIRKLTEKHPRVWDDKGRPLLRPGQIQTHGAAAINHRKELLDYIDELEQYAKG